MNSWSEEVKQWVPLVGLVAQAAITWWKVGMNERDITKLQEEVDSLREWRAQAREQIRQWRRSHGEDED